MYFIVSRYLFISTLCTIVSTVTYYYMSWYDDLLLNLCRQISWVCLPSIAYITILLIYLSWPVEGLVTARVGLLDTTYTCMKRKKIKQKWKEIYISNPPFPFFPVKFYKWAKHAHVVQCFTIDVPHCSPAYVNL